MAERIGGEKDKSQVIHFGVSLDQLDNAIWSAIVATYWRVVKGHEIDPDRLPIFDVSEVHDIHQQHGVVGFRFGSEFSQDSKLVVEEVKPGIVEFDFDPNASYASDYEITTERGAEISKISQEFKARVDELLLALGLAESIVS
jgi:hypothetical protein